MPLTFTAEQVNAIRATVRSDTPDGFASFYELIHNRLIPDHAYKWVEFVYAERHGLGRDVMIEAFRGSTKTTTFTNDFLAYQIGLHPERDNIIIQAGDESANDNAQSVKDTIDHNPAWKFMFPEIVADEKRGWGEGGYYVKRTDMDYGEWVRTASKFPTFVGYSVTSESIVGRHPNGLMILDDILNEENTASDRVMQGVEHRLVGTILPCKTSETLCMFIFTPWREDDPVQKQKDTGAYAVLHTPACDPELTWAAWPDFLPLDKLREIKSKDTTGGIEFARMYLLDLTAASNRIYTFQEFPHAQIQVGWPHWGGADYAAVASSAKTVQQSHFALAYLTELPGGGAVVVGGVLEQVGQAEAENYVLAAQAGFPNWLHAMIEGDGKGEEFYMVLYRHPELRLIMKKTGEVFQSADRAKPQRAFKILQPLLKTGRLKISDAETKFLSAVRHWLNMYPNVGQHDPGWDAIDAIVWAVVSRPELFAIPVSSPKASVWGESRPRRPDSPWAALAKQTRYG